MKIIALTQVGEMVSSFITTTDERRCPRRDAPAADQYLKILITHAPPCLVEALRRGILVK
jgi:hypothetical protein